MTTTTFAISTLCLATIGFVAGYALGPIQYRGELERARISEEQAHESLWGARRAKAEHSFQLVRYLDEGNPDKAKAWLNLMVDSWIAETSAHSRMGSWINLDMEPSLDTVFLAKVARHREKHPVTYNDPEYAEWVSNILSTAVQVEKKRNRNTDSEN
jgi:hypothetical protein